MRILLLSGHPALCNMGDVAMLQVAVARLKKLWPDAIIEVTTARPDLLYLYCPEAHPVHVGGLEEWFAEGNLFGFLRRVVPRRPYSRLLMVEAHIRERWPSVLHALVLLKSKFPGSTDIRDMGTFWRAFSRADLVVLGGGGLINDTSKGFEALSNTLLDLFAMAARHGKPTAMFGQGIGPIQGPALLRKAQAVFPLVDLSALRESRAGLPLLYSLGVAPSQTIVTGDDAIELAYASRPQSLGSGIGVSLRVAPYSGVQDSHIIKLRDVFQRLPSKYAASFVPIPICFCPRESDVATLNQLLAGMRDELNATERLADPAAIITQVGRCRVVVAGSYHAGVFALAQGVSVVGLALSAYYANKFMGLADQFGPGCEVIRLDDAAFSDHLMGAIDRAWQSADRSRPRLLDLAERQTQLGHAAYERVPDLVRARHSARSHGHPGPGAVASSEHRSRTGS